MQCDHEGATGATSSILFDAPPHKLINIRSENGERSSHLLLAAGPLFFLLVFM